MTVRGGGRRQQQRSAAPAAVTAEELLDDGLRRLRLAGEPPLARPLLRFIDLIEGANPVYRLVDADRTRLVTHHVLDSLAAVPVLRTFEPRATLLDVGSGAGLPGVPLALALPEVRVTLLERSTRRAEFLRHVRRELPLPGVRIVDRPLAAAGAETYDLIVCRAVAPLARLLPDLARLARRGHALHARTTVVVYQGTAATVRAELARPELQARRSLRVRVVALQVPQLAAERHLIMLTGFAPGRS